MLKKMISTTLLVTAFLAVSICPKNPIVDKAFDDSNLTGELFAIIEEAKGQFPKPKENLRKYSTVASKIACWEMVQNENDAGKLENVTLEQLHGLMDECYKLVDNFIATDPILEKCFQALSQSGSIGVQEEADFMKSFETFSREIEEKIRLFIISLHAGNESNA